ncbi:MAG: hypothetical protein K2X47_17780 [Bdellovibrionales bacterium]|nr:hypothetical protein [Bdellovibrionales bacterium]
MTKRVSLFLLGFFVFVGLIPTLAFAVMAPIYRSIHSAFPSGKVGVNQLLLKTEKAKEIEWIQVMNFGEAQHRGPKGWLPRTHLLCLEDLQITGSEWGYGFTRSSTEVRENPQESAKLIVLLPTETRLRIARTVGNWAQVSMDDSQGYTSLSRLITKIDFEGNTSACFNSSMNSEMKKAPNFSSISIARIPFLSKVKRLRTLKTHWGYARLKDHGDVWWPMEKTKDGVSTTPIAGREQIPSVELFQHQVRNMLQSPVDPNFWIAAADGIYRSNDGLLWEKIPRFGSEAPPIAFVSDGTLIVGAEVSRNRGETFESFVRWEKALNEIYRQQGRHPEHIKVLSVQTSPAKGNSNIILEVETSKNRKVEISTRDFGKTWNTSPALLKRISEGAEDFQGIQEL